MSRSQIHRDQILKYILVIQNCFITSLKWISLPESSLLYFEPCQTLWILQVFRRTDWTWANNRSPLHYFNVEFKDPSFPSHFYCAVVKSFYYVLGDFKIVTQPYPEFSNPNWEELLMYVIIVCFFGSVLRSSARSYFHFRSTLLRKGLSLYALFISCVG